MNLADVFTFLFVILGLILVLVAYWLGAKALFPELTKRCAERFGRSPLLATSIGLVGFVPLLAVGMTMSGKAPTAPLKVLGVIIMVSPILIGLVGSSGLALRIGQGLARVGDELEPWRAVWRGGLVLALTFVLPFLGWALLVWTLVAGFGALVLAQFRRKEAPVTAGAPTGQSLLASDPSPAP